MKFRRPQFTRFRRSVAPPAERPKTPVRSPSAGGGAAHRLGDFARWPWLRLTIAAACAVLALVTSVQILRDYEETVREAEIVESLTNMVALIPGSRPGVYAQYRAMQVHIDSASPVYPLIAADLRIASDAMEQLDQARTRFERDLGEGERLQTLGTIEDEGAAASRALHAALAKVRDLQKQNWNELMRRVRVLAILGAVIIAMALLMGQQMRSWRRDLARREIIEHELRSSQARFRELFEHVLEGIYQSTREGAVLAANPALVQMLGYGSEDELKTAFTAYDAYPDPAERDKFIGRIEREGSIRNVELELRRKDGQRITVLASGRAVRDDAGDILYYEGSIVDISARKVIEKELAQARDEAILASRLKSEFLANVSHEIRTPMNGVIGMTGLLLDTELSPEQREYALAVRRSAEFLLGIINDILDFSKIEAGKLELEKIEFALRPCVEDVLELLSDQAESRGLELGADIAEEVPNTVIGDPGRLRQVITNLVGNALKFTHAGEVTVKVNLVAGEEQQVALRFEVTDTGIGITPEQMQRIFEPFCQGDGSTNRKYGGTGLGLSISRRIVELMQGSMSLRSEPGRGSTFAFSARFGAVLAHQPGPDSSLEGVGLYLLDASGTNAGIVARHARAWGMEVTAGAVFPAVRPGSRTIILVDERWPGSVAELVERASALEHADARVYLLASYGRRGIASDAAGHLVAGIITRPVRMRRLRAAWVKEWKRASGQSPVDTYSTPPRILIAEDNAVNQTVALRLVEKLGYRADIVASGNEAIEAVSAGAYDLVLMDCQMPDTDGFEATQEIRSRESGRPRIPIIAMTAHAAPGDRARCIECGMDDYISKPIKAEELASVLSRWLPDPVVRPAGSLQPRPLLSRLGV